MLTNSLQQATSGEVRYVKLRYVKLKTQNLLH